eukprot:5648973-Alexandrium_andersonii.AAC.1
MFWRVAVLARTGWPPQRLAPQPPQIRPAVARAARSPTGGPSQVSAFWAAWLQPWGRRQSQGGTEAQGA